MDYTLFTFTNYRSDSSLWNTKLKRAMDIVRRRGLFIAIFIGSHFIIIPLPYFPWPPTLFFFDLRSTRTCTSSQFLSAPAPESEVPNHLNARTQVFALCCVQLYSQFCIGARVPPPLLCLHLHRGQHPRRIHTHSDPCLHSCSHPIHAWVRPLWMTSSPSALDTMSVLPVPSDHTSSLNLQVRWHLRSHVQLQ